MVVQITHILFE